MRFPTKGGRLSFDTSNVELEEEFAVSDHGPGISPRYSTPADQIASLD